MKMPSNSDFKLDILVADTPVPDYSKDGEHFVECNLSTPVSYMHRQSDSVNGETEVQVYALLLPSCIQPIITVKSTRDDTSENVTILYTLLSSVKLHPSCSERKIMIKLRFTVFRLVPITQ